MKGVIFNLLEAAVSNEIGDDGWDEVLATAGVEGAYTSLGTYDDEEFMRLAAAASPALGMTPEELVIWFGRNALGRLALSYPKFFTEHTSLATFLLTLNDIIHPEVRKIYPGADVPQFAYRSSEPDRVVMAYRSNRGLCDLGTGLIEGAAAHFGEDVRVEQTSCAKRGDEECVYDVRVVA